MPVSLPPGKFGYDVEDGKLVPNEREQAATARMRRLRKRGKSLMAIRDTMRKSGVPISHETVAAGAAAARARGDGMTDNVTPLPVVNQQADD